MNDLESDLFYKHSGRLGWSWIGVPLLALPALVLISAVYAWILVYCPVIGVVNIVFLGGYVVAGGVVIGYIGTWTHSRSPGFVALLAFGLSVVGYYFVWVFFIQALSTYSGVPCPSLLDLTLNPIGVWGIAYEINNEGWWGPSGLIQWLLCLVEAVIMLVGTPLLAAGVIKRSVYCEHCNSWCQPKDSMRLLPDPETIGDQMLQADHLAILALPEAKPTDFPRYEATILECTGCHDTQAIRIELVDQMMEDGKPTESREDLDGVLMQRKNG